MELLIPFFLTISYKNLFSKRSSILHSAGNEFVMFNFYVFYFYIYVLHHCYLRYNSTTYLCLVMSVLLYIVSLYHEGRIGSKSWTHFSS